MRSEIFLDEALKEAKEKGLIKGSDINLEMIQKGIGKLTGSVRKRVERVFERVAQGLKNGLGSISPKELAKVLPLVAALSGCTFDVTGLGDLKFKDAQADGADTGGKDGNGDVNGDAKIDTNPIDAGDVGDILDDIEELYVPETKDTKDVENDDGTQPIDAEVEDEGDAGDGADGKDTDVGGDADTGNPDSEITDPCAGVDCDDKDPCTEDKCNEATGGCSNPPKPLTDDGDKCTEESCDQVTGKTVHTPVDPDDGDPCTDDKCDPVTGKKTNTPKDVDDKDPCTNDSCDPVTGEPINADKDCGDDNPFTTDDCDPGTGDCTHVPPVCDDKDPCTKDGYDPLKGCSNEPVDCEDGDGCTENHACNTDTGKCESTPKGCGDGDECTKDICLSPDGDCVNPPKPIENDANPCTKDGCDPVTGEATHDEIPCSDGSACTDADACNPADGKCKGEAVDCDDGDGCTGDSCDPAEGCKNTPVNTDDGNKCTDDECNTQTGEVTHKAKDVSDGKTCTTDGCNPLTGEKINMPNNAACAGLNDQCAKGVCDPADLSANDITGCTKSFLPFGTLCDDGNACSLQDLCDAGFCVGTDWETCDDGVACTKDSSCNNGECGHTPDDTKCPPPGQCQETMSCDVTLGCVAENKADGTPCDLDGKPKCTPDTCGQGECIPGQKECQNDEYVTEECWDENGQCVVTIKNKPLTLVVKGPGGTTPDGTYSVQLWYNGVSTVKTYYGVNSEYTCPQGVGPCIISVKKLGNTNYYLQVWVKDEQQVYSTYSSQVCTNNLGQGNIPLSKIVESIGDAKPQVTVGNNMTGPDPGVCVTNQANMK